MPSLRGSFLLLQKLHFHHPWRSCIYGVLYFLLSLALAIAEKIKGAEAPYYKLTFNDRDKLAQRLPEAYQLGQHHVHAPQSLCSSRRTHLA